MNKISILDNLSQEQLLTIIKYAQADTRVQGIACMNVNCGTCLLHRSHSPSADDIDTCVHCIIARYAIALKQVCPAGPCYFANIGEVLQAYLLRYSPEDLTMELL